MKKLVLFVAVFAALVSCGHNKKDAASVDSINKDSVAAINVKDTAVIIDITGEWVGEAPTANAPAGTKAPTLSLKADKSATATNIPATKAPATKGAKATPAKAPVVKGWKQKPGTPASNNNATLVLFSSVPGKQNTDSITYQIVKANDSTLTIQSETGIYKFKKHH